jgi:hypothetical protein
MDDLPGAAPGQIVDQSGIRGSSYKLADDQRAVQFGCTEKIECGNVSLIV